MNVFEAAKTISCTDAALKLGISGKRLNASRGLFLCPFHNEKTPSLITYDKPHRNDFYCFGCRKYGDTTDLYSQITGERPVKAAESACRDFGVPYDTRMKNPPEPLNIGPRGEVRILAAAVHEWRRYQVRYWQDTHARLTEAMRPLIEADQDDSEAFTTLLQQSVTALMELERWEAMSLQGIMQEIQTEINRYFRQATVLVPVKGVAT